MPKNESPSASPPHDSLSGCLVRLAWMFLGNGALFVLAVFIAQGPRAAISALDAAYWAVVAALIGLRYLDIKAFKGQTATSEPATMAHWRRYAVIVLAASLVGWGLAHAVAWACLGA